MTTRRRPRPLNTAYWVTFGPWPQWPPPIGQPLKRILLGLLVGWLSPHLLSLFSFSSFNLGVATMAMPQEYTENGSRQMKLPKRGDGGNERARSDRSLIFPPRPKHAKLRHPRVRQAPFLPALSPDRPHTPCLHAHRIAEWRAEAPRRPVRRAPTLAPPVPSQVLSVLRSLSVRM